MPSGQALSVLCSQPQGLEEGEAALRLERLGPNRIPEARRITPLRTFLRQFASPLIYLLLLAGIASLLIGDRTDSLFIFGVLLLNALVGAFQEWRADASARALRALVPQTTLVRRGGNRREAPSDTVVLGDVVELESGMRVTADLRLIEAKGLLVDEALLTGESQAVAKNPESLLAPDCLLADRENMAHAGTAVVEGRALGVVVATGSNTAIGKIGSSLDEVARAASATPLLRRMAQLARQIAVGAIGLILALAGLLVLQGESWHYIALLGIALAVSAIPEGLPIAVTVALSAAASRMARRNVIVRALPAVEGLGSCTLIASDKTGTLTMNSLSVERAMLPDGTSIDRQDWNAGRISAELRKLGEVAALCNEARLDMEGCPVGDKVDVALLDFAAETGNDPADLLAEQRLSIIPYEAVQRFAAAEVDRGGSPCLVVKGAPETVLPMCTGAGCAAARAADEMAKAGFRVLALAECSERTVPGSISERLHGLSLVGFVGLTDPIRPGVVEAVKQCASAGISVRMVTGDHPATALAIARKLGIAERASDIVNGSELAACGQDEGSFDQKVSAARVFARTEPAQKLAIVRAFERAGEVVAVTGDGVNDGPALQAAAIGVAMGRGGTDVARGAADLVLADDNFASIVAGIEEGRITFVNIRKIVLFLLATGVAEIGMFLAALAVGLPMPLTPVQLLWLNLVTNGVQDVTLGFGRGEGNELREPPRRKLASLIDREALIVMGAAAATMAALAVWLLSDELQRGASVEQARNSVLLMTVLFQNAFLLGIRHLRVPFWRWHSPENIWLFVGIGAALSLHLGAMHVPAMQFLLEIEPVGFELVMRAAVGAIAVLVITEAAKRLAKRETIFPAG